ncbi:DUF6507 family protein [Streptomyces sp. INA 01156]
MRTSNSLSGAATATNEYVKGNLDMAARAQANALKEPKIDLPGAGGSRGHVSTDLIDPQKSAVHR